MKQLVNQSDKQSNNQKKSDFSRGNVVGNIMKLAASMTLAQLINVSYNIVDRIYIGMIPENATLSSAGLRLYPPIVSIMIAFANLSGIGGVPLCSTERGRGNEKEAEATMGGSFAMIVAVGILLTVLGPMFKRPMLYLFGASDATISYVDAYVTVYLTGNILVTTDLGMNSFINSQRFGIVGMMIVLLGVVTNTALGPVFIFISNMGVRGAALATILSQMLLVLWILVFLTGRRTILKLWPSAMRLDCGRLLCIVSLGMPGLTMPTTNSLAQVMYNSMLQKFGGDLYVGIMTVINSVREVISMFINGLTNSAQPVLGFGCGAREYKRIQKSIVFMPVVRTLYTMVAWGFVDRSPVSFIHTSDREGGMVEAGIPIICTYFFGFFMMSLQFARQSVSVGLGKSRNAIFFSISRKAIIVIPLIIILPIVFGMGTQGILMAEPISNFIGGGAYFGIMLLTVWPELKRDGEKIHS